MTTQQLFNFAQERYRYARGIVTKLIRCSHVNRTDSDKKALYFQFDAIVQYVLLKVALADGKFLEIEGEFIDQITDSYDILQLFDGHDEHYNWSFAGAHLTYKQVTEIVNKVEKLALKHIVAFADLLAELAAAEGNKDSVKQLYGCINDIALAFIIADGTATEREKEIAATVVRLCLTEPWRL